MTVQAVMKIVADSNAINDTAWLEMLKQQEDLYLADCDFRRIQPDMEAFKLHNEARSW